MKVDVLDTYGKVDVCMVDKLLAEEMNKNESKIVVLDDDPTGTQTVYDVDVYTDWTKAHIIEGLKGKNRMFYIMTNSRGMTAHWTKRVHREIANIISEASKECGVKYILVSRSDSTLRGHYPIETEVLRDELERSMDLEIDGEILCPFFKEGGRYTFEDVHYVRYGDELVPVGETEFAKDSTFGYNVSDMREYIVEKTDGGYSADSVTSISLKSIRSLDLDGIEKQLKQIQNFNKVIVNAVEETDIKIFCIALYRAMASGKIYLFRVAASFVKVLGGIEDRTLLSRSEMILTECKQGGLVVVGSCTKKTNAQLEKLRELSDLLFLEFNSDLILGEGCFKEEIRRCVEIEEACICNGKTVVVFTKRKQLTQDTDTKEQALLRSVKISDAVRLLVEQLNVKPAFVIAKGGITSSDIGKKGLHVVKAKALGQIKPGVPVWRIGEESKFPNMPFVIFPGNVGDEAALKEAVEILTTGDQ